MAVYLTGDLRFRLKNLMMERNVSQSQLAKVAGISESTFSRFMSGQIQDLSAESVIRIARELNVSTDFLLGIINVPDKRNYDISDLGLTAQAARNLYTQRVNRDVVAYLLENPKFGETTRLIADYMSGSLAAGIAAQNELLDHVAGMLIDAKLYAGARDVKVRKIPKNQVLDKIQTTFAAAVRDMEKDVTLEVAAKKLTNEQFERIRSEVTKDEALAGKQITPEQFADMILASIQGQNLLSAQTALKLRDALIAVAEDMRKADGEEKEERGQTLSG